jgi:hypothetical protein
MPLDNLIQRADLNQKLTRALEIKGQKSPVLQLDNSVVAVVIAEDLTQQKNFNQPDGRKAAFSDDIPLVAGQNPLGVIMNPVGSGIVVVVRFAFMRSSATTELIIGFADPLALPGTVVTPTYLDNRNGGVSPVLCRTGTDAVLRIVTPLARFNTGATTVGVPEMPPWSDVVVNPGQAFGVQQVVAGADGSATIWWEEFPV